MHPQAGGMGGVCTHIFLVIGWFLGGIGRPELDLKVDPLVDDGGAMERGAQQPRQPHPPGL